MSRVVPLYLGLIINGLAAILSIPVMIAQGGLSAWAPVGVGQSVGGIVAAIISYGWGITGPADIARLQGAERRREFAESVRTRIVITVPALLFGALLCLTVTGWEGLLLASAGLASTALVGIGGAFYFLGTGQYWSSFLLDSLPRAVGTLAGMLVLSMVSDVSLAVVPIGTAVGGVVSALAAQLAVNQGVLDKDPLPRRQVRALLVSRRHGLIASVSTGIFQMAPTLLIGWLAPSVLAPYVFYDKVYKQAMTFVSPVFNVLQGWVPRGRTSDEVQRRLSRSLQLGVGGGVGVLLLVMIAGWSVVEWLSAGEVAPMFLAILLLGLMIGLSTVDLVVSRVGLVVQGKLRWLSRASVLGLLVGALLVAVASPVAGLDGALAATDLGIATRLSVSVWAYRRS